LALTPSNDEAFLREVDDELRRDQMTTLWQRYGKLAIVGIALFLVALAAFLWWRAEAVRKNEAQAEQLSVALADVQGGRKAEAEQKFAALAAEGTSGYRASALLSKAALAEGRGDKKAALSALASVAADEALPQAYRDLATIKQSMIDFDDVKPQVIVDRLKPLAVEGEPFFGTAGELTAIAYIKLNRGAEAGRLLAAIAKDPTAPETLRSRVIRLAAMLGTYVDPASLKKD